MKNIWGQVRKMKLQKENHLKKKERSKKKKFNK